MLLLIFYALVVTNLISSQVSLYYLTMDIPIQDDLTLSNLTLCDFTLGYATLGNFIPVICVHHLIAIFFLI